MCHAQNKDFLIRVNVPNVPANVPCTKQVLLNVPRLPSECARHRTLTGHTLSGARARVRARTRARARVRARVRARAGACARVRARACACARAHARATRRFASICACVRVRARARARACVRACVRARKQVRARATTPARECCMSTMRSMWKVASSGGFKPCFYSLP